MVRTAASMTPPLSGESLVPPSGPCASYVKLSIAAKTYFMLGEKKGNAMMAELTDLATKFGWKVTQQQVFEAATYLSSLGLVNLRPTG
jgi:hypothetical protein